MSKSISPLPVGELLFWVDTEHLKTQSEQSDIDSAVVAIQEDTWLIIVREDAAKISEQLKQGAPFQKTIFDKVAKEIRQDFLLQPFRFSLQAFAQACLYSKRYHEMVMNLPEEFYNRIWKEARDTQNWDVIQNKKSIMCRKQLKKYPGVYLRERFVVDVPHRDVAEFVWNPVNDPAYKQAVCIEQVGECGAVLHVITAKSFGGLAKSKDYALAIFRKDMDENTSVLLGCSINHKKVPSSDKYTRAKVDVAAFIVTKLDVGTEVIAISQLDLTGEAMSVMTSSDVMIPRTHSVHKSFKSLEKSKKKK